VKHHHRHPARSVNALNMFIDTYKLWISIDAFHIFNWTIVTQSYLDAVHTAYVLLILVGSTVI